VVIETANAGTDTILSSVSYTANVNVENLTLMGTSAINAIGNVLNNTLTGNSADNVLDGGGGNDTLVGGAGNDTALFADLYANYQITIFVKHIDDLDGTDLLTGVELLQFADGTIAAPAEVNLTGGDGDDTLVGTNADEMISGGAGNDVLTGNGGLDYINGGAGIDTAVYSDIAANYQVQWYGEQLLVLHAGGEGADYGDLLTGVELLQFSDGTVSVPAGPPIIQGDDSDNTLVGTAGDDIIYGEAGDDVLTGGEGNDAMDGGLGQDTAVFSDVFANYQIIADDGQTYVLHLGGSGVDGTDRVSGIELLQFSDGIVSVPAGPSIVLGDDSANTLVGTVGDDIIHGEGGNDVLTGGEGNDAMDGGIGQDTAVFSDVYANYQIIFDDGETYISHLEGSGADGTDQVSGIVEHTQIGKGGVAVIGFTMAIAEKEISFHNKTGSPAREDSERHAWRLALPVLLTLYCGVSRLGPARPRSPHWFVNYVVNSKIAVAGAPGG
jgi:Ca2+-binding RTX toxin-like protein